MLRRLAERLSRRVVLKRRLPRDFGGQPLFVTPAASLRYWRRDLGKADPLLLDFAREFVRPGATVWDVGANVGLFAFAAAQRAGASGAVVAIEPDAWLADLLRRSARLPVPDRARVEVVPAAVADTVGVARLHIASRARSANYLEGFGRVTAGGSRETRTVQTVTLDSLLERFSPPHVVKIDVEGAEGIVLAGARRLLSEHRPIILCEVFGASKGPVADALRSTSYLMYDMAAPSEARRPVETAVYHTLARPA